MVPFSKSKYSELFLFSLFAGFPGRTGGLKSAAGKVGTTKRPDEFPHSPFCGSDVKVKNLLDHKLRVHREGMDTWRESLSITQLCILFLGYREDELSRFFYNSQF